MAGLLKTSADAVNGATSPWLPSAAMTISAITRYGPFG